MGVGGRRLGIYHRDDRQLSKAIFGILAVQILLSMFMCLITALRDV